MTKTERLTWLKERQGGIGATDIASIVGVGFRSPTQVYEEKIAPDVAAEKPAHPLLLIGLATEELNARLYSEKMESDVMKSAGISWGKCGSRSPIFASLDYLAFGKGDSTNGRPLETKYTPFIDDRFGEPMTADVPTGYMVQTQWQMFAVDHPELADLSLLSGTGDHRIYRMTYDSDLVRMLLDVADEFWNKFIVPRQAPPADWEAGAGGEVLKRCEALVPNTKIDLGVVGADLAKDYKRFKLIEKEAGEEASKCYAGILGIMGEAERAEAQGFKFKRSIVAGGPVSYTREAYTRLTVTAPKEKK